MEETCRAPGPQMGDEDRGPPEIPFGRRRELMNYAAQVAEDVMGKVKPHELCVFNNMVRNLIPRGDF